MNENTPPEEKNLKTFDMYHFFSRKDVIAAIILILLLLIFALYELVFAPQII